MATLAVEQRYGDLVTALYPSGYDSTKLNLGSLMCQKSGAGAMDKWCGPFPVSIARPMEAVNGALACTFPQVIPWSSTVNWVFFADGSAAAGGTRNIILYTYNRTTNVFTWIGYIIVKIVGGSTAAAQTVHGFRMTYDLYTTGTASASGTAVTGSGTAWQASRLTVGSRIGFGSQTPSAITTWYEIAAIGNDTNITLTSSAGTVGSGSYVIEDLRALIQTTATIPNGTFEVVKGLRPELFTLAPTVVTGIILAATVMVAPTAVLANHVTNGTVCFFTTAAAHNLCVTSSITLSGWTWAAGGGNVNGTWLITSVPSTTTFTITPTSCPTTGSNPTVIGTCWALAAPLTTAFAAQTTTGTTITYTTAQAHNLYPGQWAFFAGWIWDGNGNGNFKIETCPSTTTFTVNPPTWVGSPASAVPINATAANHTSDGTSITIRTNVPHNFILGQTVTFSTWTWATGGGSINGFAYKVSAIPTDYTFSVVPAEYRGTLSTGVCPTSGSNPTVVGTVLQIGIVVPLLAVPTATTSDHTTNGTTVVIKTNGEHRLSVGLSIYLTGWTWSTGGGVVNGVWPITAITDSTHFTVTPTTCPTTGSNPTVVGVINSTSNPDNFKAGYWLADVAITLNPTNVPGNQYTVGLGLQPKDSWTQQFCWSIDVNATVLTLYKYNTRATLAAGRDLGALVLKTGTYTINTTTPSGNNNGVYAVVNHGPGKGVGCLYFADLTLIYRTKDVTTIVNGDTLFIPADSVPESPTGTASLFAASSLLGSIRYISEIDKFVVLVTVAGIPYRSYVTRYKDSGTPFDRVFLTDIRQIDSLLGDTTNTVPVPSYLSRAFTCDEANGMLYLTGIGVATTTNFVYTIPIAADWEYTDISNQVIITPAISTPNCSSFVRVYYSRDFVIGSMSGTNLGTVTEPPRVFYRMSGITDNSGPWIPLDDYGDLSAAGVASSIQFKYEFRTIGLTCTPARLLSMTVLYNDISTDSHFQPSAGFSDKINKRFAWRFSTAFGTTVPALRVRIYDAVMGSLLVDDNTVTLAGTWEKSTNDGSSWTSWNNTDKGNDTTYLRFTPASLGSNLKVRAYLTLN